jgi:hypothetical protein
MQIFFTFSNGSYAGGWYQQSWVFEPMPSQTPNAAPVVPDNLANIDDELDIIRGRVPTPQGYTVEPSRMKALMAKRASLVGSQG